MTPPADQGTPRRRVGTPNKPRNWSTLGSLRRVDPLAWEQKVRAAMDVSGADVRAAAKALEISPRQLFRILSEARFADVERLPVGNPNIRGKRPQ